MADEQPNPFATYEDLEKRWHTLTPDEQAQADELLLDASESIRNHVSVYPETHEESWWTAHRRGLEIVCCQMVRTAMEQQVSGVPHGRHAEHRDHRPLLQLLLVGFAGRLPAMEQRLPHRARLGWPARLQHRHGIRGGGLMERVDVYRGAAEMDADGNPVQGEMRHVATLMGFVEPVEASQSPGADSQGVARRFTLYFRGEPTGILGHGIASWCAANR